MRDRPQFSGQRASIMGRLENKVAVITGAASGIGRASAVRFAGEGAAVVIADLNQDGGESAVRDCKEHGGHAVFQRADVSTEADVQAMIARAVNEFGGLDIIYNNAGLAGALGPLEQTTVENWDRTLAVLLRGVFLGIKHACPRCENADVARSSQLPRWQDCRASTDFTLIVRPRPGLSISRARPLANSGKIGSASIASVRG